jgi:hypothetical protein
MIKKMGRIRDLFPPVIKGGIFFCLSHISFLQPILGKHLGYT